MVWVIWHILFSFYSVVMTGKDILVTWIKSTFKDYHVTLHFVLLVWHCPMLKTKVQYCSFSLSHYQQCQHCWGQQWHLQKKKKKNRNTLDFENYLNLFIHSFICSLSHFKNKACIKLCTLFANIFLKCSLSTDSLCFYPSVFYLS